MLVLPSVDLICSPFFLYKLRVSSKVLIEGCLLAALVQRSELGCFFLFLPKLRAREEGDAFAIFSDLSHH
jgi:hypothetical protein